MQLNKYQFADDAWEGNMAEISMGKLAERMNCSKDVRDFARRMVADHTKANQQLTAALHGSVTLPTRLNPTYQDMYRRLAAMACPDFDKVYMKNMVDEHKVDIARFRDEAAAGANPDMKAYAQKTLPVLQQHLQLAQSVQAKVGEPGPGVTAASHPSASSGAVVHRDLAVRNVSNQDLTYLNHVGADAQGEINVGNIVAGDPNRKEVGKLASEMVQDFQQELNELETALPQGITLPGDLNDHYRALRERLLTHSGETLDLTYMRELVDCLQDLVALSKQEASQGDEPKLKAYAAKALPRFQQQLQKADGTMKAAGNRP
jgi:putative membrane protein